MHRWRCNCSPALYLVLVAVVAFGVGGYIAGRMRTPIDASADEIEFRDGTHGVLVWAIAMVLTVLLTWAAAQSLTRLAAPSADHPAPRSRSPARTSSPSISTVCSAPRSGRRTRTSPMRDRRPHASCSPPPATAASPSDDRAYLVRLTAANTGLAPPEAEKRVDTIITQARDNIRKARRAGVILAFMAGAAALLGAAVAWFAACAGGSHRDDTAPSMTWGWNGPRSW